MKPGDVFELECMAQVASVTTTIEGMPDRLIMHFYEMKLDQNTEWTVPEPELQEIPTAPVPPRSSSTDAADGGSMTPNILQRLLEFHLRHYALG